MAVPPYNRLVPRVQLLATCLVDRLFPDVGLSAASVLERIGYDVHVPEGQTCCGQPALNAGFLPEARAMARYTVDLLSRDAAPIVIPSGSCADMLIHHAPELLHAEPEAAARASQVAARTYEFTQFLVDVSGRADCGACLRSTATYHPSCHGLRGLGLERQPQALLDAVDGLELRPLGEAQTCCGFGGLFAVKMDGISGAMLDRKLDAIDATGADVVIGTDVSCLMHIGGGLHRRGSRVQARHIAEVLASQALPGKDAGPDPQRSGRE
jgi:L-lactate dehydrogenase complex protein LldE